MTTKDKVLRTAGQIIDLLGGTSVMGRAFDATPQQVTNWRRAGRFPAQLILRMMPELTARGYVASPTLWGVLPPLQGIALFRGVTKPVEVRVAASAKKTVKKKATPKAVAKKPAPTPTKMSERRARELMSIAAKALSRFKGAPKPAPKDGSHATRTRAARKAKPKAPRKVPAPEVAVDQAA